MTTGDIKNNLRKLQNELKLIQYMEEMDFEKMIIGLSAPFLPILHYVFTEYSCDLSSYFSAKGYDLYAKSDFRFLEIIYKILVQEFGTKPMLTKQQFFSIGYSEMKVIFTTKIVSLCRQKHESMTKKVVKKKKTSTLATKTCHRQNKQCPDGKIQNSISNQHLRDTVVPGNTVFVEDKMIVDDSECSIPQNISPSEHRIKPPKPNPELALSPIKSLNDQSVNGNYKTECREIDSRLLDLTDVGEDSFVETGGVIEVIDSDYEKSVVLPEFTITKHSVGGQNLKMKTNDWTISNIVGTGSHFEASIETSVNKQFHDGHSLPGSHSLPGNISVTSPHSKQNTMSKQCQQCEQCFINSNIIKMLVQKVEVMEGDIFNLVSVNNDLSAKVVLMETKVKIMENPVHKEKEDYDDGKYDFDENKYLGNVNTAFDQYTYVGNMNNALAQYKDDENDDLDECKNVSNISVPSDDSGISNLVTMGSNHINAKKSYSPIKYTDDDIIIKDFKPISMKDVHNMMNEVILDDNKENYGIFNQIKKVKVRKEALTVKVVDDTHVDETIGNASDHKEYEVDDLFLDSCNVSNLFDDDFTEQAVRNVRKRLQETEDMLKNGGNYIVK